MRTVVDSARIWRDGSSVWLWEVRGRRWADGGAVAEDERLDGGRAFTSSGALSQLMSSEAMCE